MKHLETSILIEADPREVWDVLSDVTRYEQWNPFIVSAEGDVAVGKRLTLRMQPAGGRAMTIRPQLTVVEPGNALEWLGSLGVRGIFDGRHRFALQAVAEGTRVVQSEMFTGALVPLLWRNLEVGTRAGFTAFNVALRERVLSRATSMG